jgi:hypothetical protein
MRYEEIDTWVVYLMTVQKSKDGPRRSVCTQTEWDEMELAQPGYHLLIQAGIASESEAELLARGTSGDPKPRRSTLR